MSPGLGALLALLMSATPASSGQSLPAALKQQLPPRYHVLAWAQGPMGGGKAFYVVAVASDEERPQDARSETPAPARPLLVYERQTDGGFRLAGRNDTVVLRADEGGQCDPFDPGEITVKGAYFTVENGVACGAHWTDYVTFRFDAERHSFVFDNQRYQSWKFNPDTREDAEALVLDVSKVERPRKGAAPSLGSWRRR